MGAALAGLGTGAALFHGRAGQRPADAGALGAERAGALIEAEIARIARGLIELGVRQLIVAGGETSGAVVQALGLEQIAIGEQIDPGVPWCSGRAAAVDADISIALKSGNFGAADFFLKAFAQG